MAAVRSVGNRSTEKALAKAFRHFRFTGWRSQPRNIKGRPDFIFPKQSVLVFIDGCFWHGCAVCYRRPKASRAYWDDKVRRNRDRDKNVTRELRKLGYRVIRIWEHELREARWPSRLRRALEGLH
jgi:DNA mismatch endonuclease (patch repair protein)